MSQSRRQFGQILLWSGISNAVLVACFVLVGNFSQLSKYVSDYVNPPMTKVARVSDPLAVSRVYRQDNELLTRGVQSGLKESIMITRRLQSRSAAETERFDYPSSPSGSIDDTVDAVSYGAPPTTEETLGMRIAPVLRKNPATGQLEIGNFKSMTFVGDEVECLDVGYSMLGDSGTSNDVLDVLTATSTITIAKICAKNGSVVISCRNNQITVSPRATRPDDKCVRQS